jgi:Domain of unknown function (DUF4340)
MLAKRNIRLLLSLIVLLMFTGLMLFYRQQEKTGGVNDSLFKVTDLSRIDQVMLESQSAGKINFQFTNGVWKINDRWVADRQLVTVLFAALEQVKPKRAAAKNQRDSINAQFKKNGVMVSLWEKGQLQKKFYSQGNPRKNETYFELDGEETPYLVTIPGYRVYIAELFELDEYGWRDKRIFDFKWINFTSLQADFPFDAPANFEIRRKGGVFSVMDEESDTSKINSFLDDISLLVADKIVPPGYSSRFDSLVRTKPTMEILITDIAKRTYSLALFPPLKNENLYVGKLNSGEVALFNPRKVIGITRKRGYFRSGKK